MKYRVKLEKTEEGYAVWCPGLPGCWSQGTTEEEALENIKDAIEVYLATVEDLVKDKTTRAGEAVLSYEDINHRFIYTSKGSACALPVQESDQ